VAFFPVLDTASIKTGHFSYSWASPAAVPRSALHSPPSKNHLVLATATITLHLGTAPASAQYARKVCLFPLKSRREPADLVCFGEPPDNGAVNDIICCPPETVRKQYGFTVSRCLGRANLKCSRFNWLHRVLGGGIFLSMYSGDLCADMILAILACLS
jgi:hypothetical protein